VQSSHHFISLPDSQLSCVAAVLFRAMLRCVTSYGAIVFVRPITLVRLLRDRIHANCVRSDGSHILRNFAATALIFSLSTRSRREISLQGSPPIRTRRTSLKSFQLTPDQTISATARESLESNALLTLYILLAVLGICMSRRVPFQSNGTWRAVLCRNSDPRSILLGMSCDRRMD
jgi:hypothetical protein